MEIKMIEKIPNPMLPTKNFGFSWDPAGVGIYFGIVYFL